ncbi:hypothetical protein HDU97_009249 [Phlyctochytrium planicorne]|nr:hypothetical protein HDU97_009249 [Phlyctochytrium planicorne]
MLCRITAIIPSLLMLLTADAVTASNIFSLDVNPANNILAGSVGKINKLERRQDTSTPLTPTFPQNDACNAILTKAIQETKDSCQQFNYNVDGVPNPRDIQNVWNGFNQVCKTACESTACAQSGTKYKDQVAKTCPADYVFQEFSFDSVPTRATDIVKDKSELISKAGLCVRDMSGNYCVPTIMSALFGSFNADGSVNQPKYTAAVCSNCMRRYVNSNATGLVWRKKTIGVAEITSLCGVSFLSAAETSPVVTGNSASTTSASVGLAAALVVAVSFFL